MRYATAMTLCIAAQAQAGGKPRIVLCFDDLIVSGSLNYRGAFKCEYMADGIAVLYAGIVSPAKELIEDFKERLEQRPLVYVNARRRITGVYARWKRRILNRAAGHYCGHSYDWVSKNRPDMIDVLEASTPSVELLITGFLHNTNPPGLRPSVQSVIFHVDDHGVNAIDGVFGIGEGWANAEPMLAFRQYTPMCDIDRAIYCVYEAKRMGELSGNVGKEPTTILVLEPIDGAFRQRIVPKAGIDFLKTQFDEQFGPRPLPQFFRFPPEHLL